jgi:sugar phosphate isomerase/epimerase
MIRLIAACVVVFCWSATVFAQDKPVLKAPVGLQLYSLRTQFQSEGVPRTLDRVKDLGFKYVELAGTYNTPPEKFKAMLDERGLTPIAGHFAWDRFKSDTDGIAAEAKALGLQYAGTAWVKGDKPFDEKYCREVAAEFNKAGKALSEKGLKFYYHIHGYEFVPYGDGTLFDLLVKETDPKYVSFEMDILWVVYPGQDPAKLLEKYPDRFCFTHLKDLRKGVKTGELTGNTDVRNDVTLGTGQVDYPAVFRAAAKSEVKYHFIEDESPSVITQLPQSLKFLEQFKE